MICDGKVVVLTYTNKIQSSSISAFARKKGNVKWSQGKASSQSHKFIQFDVTEHSLISILTTDLTPAPPLLLPEHMYVYMCVEARSWH